MSAVVAFTSTIGVFIKSLWSVSKLYVFWASVHHATSHLYIYLCTPNNFWGIIRSPFMVITPQCYSIDWVHQKSREIIQNMWTIIAMWFTSEIMSKIDPRRGIK